ncbi:OmpA family protein [Cupriavidus numazuensis]|uniref:Peptidoglycan-associated lipoprotein n=1 Tax=Cupriavidus numazuensis TaxID=221992 RepID=A0ABM8TLP0_9BURK|nr:OmpA family protein [Cupriavidus numazuensis]CAG2153896.1 Peptidoglycan-associated lipoprotein [Cupriavidus numazuensis]
MAHVTWTLRPRMLLVALCLLSAAPVSRAAGNLLLKEDDINEQAITNALVPHAGLPNEPAANEPADRTETLGIRYRDSPAMTDSSAAPSMAGSANLLITFTSNSAKLTHSARVALDKVARALKSNQLSPYRFRVEGHADPRGPAPANLKLSESRAEAVVAYLSEEGGVPASRLTPVGKGSAEPLNVQNPTAPENRRVTIVTVQP